MRLYLLWYTGWKGDGVSQEMEEWFVVMVRKCTIWRMHGEEKGHKHRADEKVGHRMVLA